jgi:hypothetical protein
MPTLIENAAPDWRWQWVQLQIAVTTGACDDV